MLLLHIIREGNFKIFFLISLSALFLPWQLNLRTCVTMTTYIYQKHIYHTQNQLIIILSYYFYFFIKNVNKYIYYHKQFFRQVFHLSLLICFELSYQRKVILKLFPQHLEGPKSKEIFEIFKKLLILANIRPKTS